MELCQAGCPRRYHRPMEAKPRLTIVIAAYNEEAVLPLLHRQLAGVLEGQLFDANMLYVTVDKSLYRIRLNKEGYQLPPKK